MTGNGAGPSSGTTRRIAIAGKGGAGKTATTALVARTLRLRELPVLAIDLDTNPGLAHSLGVDPHGVVLPHDFVVEDEEASYGWGLRDDQSASEIADKAAVVASDGTRVLGFGDVEGVEHELGKTVYAVRQIFDRFEQDGWVVLADLEAGPATPFEGFTRHADLVAVLVEPSRPSVWAANRILSTIEHDDVPTLLVASRVRPTDDVADLAQHFPDRAIDATIPFDPDVAAAERSGSIMELELDGPAGKAVAGLVDQLLERTGERAES